MSLYPFFVDYERPRGRLLDQQFGLGLTPKDHLTIIVPASAQRNYTRPWRNMQSGDIGSNIKEDKNKFQINLDVQHFAPEEISVKSADGYIVVEGKHDERQDEHGFISRSFVRRYPIPEGIEAEALTSKLSSDGVLTVSAPIKVPKKSSDERIVPIIQTGPVRKEESKQLE